MSDESGWPLKPSGPREMQGIRAAVKLFLNGIAGGVITLFGLVVLAMPTATRGATRSFAIDRAKQQKCVELGITLEELETLQQDAARAAELGITPDALERAAARREAGE